ncbi:hypothetical protein [Methanoregula sp. UBA64]|uniref:hypothetical protein n=1 Tax=Methanoregula sp. UBA64 TaxID=1915554 RepID=UPI0025F7D282|nr:hypothetical protein [Methanoregula sp. UBA64]
MKLQQNSKIRVASLILIVAFATILIAGCTDSASARQSQTASTNSPQNGQAAASTTIPAKATVLPASPKTTQPALTQPPSAKTLSFDPLGNKKTGDKFTITGTTALPAGTNLFWEIIPDPGTPPTGVNINAPVGVMGNSYVLKGNAAANRVSLDADMNNMKPGKYVVIVASLKGDPMTTDPSTGTLAGYTYFTLV